MPETLPSFLEILSGWPLVGLLGTLLFGGRWVVQGIYSARAGRSITPVYFWYMSMVGSLMILTYFIFGNFDWIGIIANSLPMFVSAYNIYLINKEKKIILAGENRDRP